LNLELERFMELGVCPGEAIGRRAVLREALTWLGTPFMDHQRVKGKQGGVDCAMFIAEVFERAGVFPHVDPGPYSPQWHLHRNEEKYLEQLALRAREVQTPLPGDIAVFRFARCFSHTGIVTEWPEIVHSYIRRGVELCDVSKDGAFRLRAVMFFNPWKT
jgi:cell wall-associated NlpC family hydrolase